MIPQPDPVIDFTADRVSVRAGQQVSLSWNVIGASTISMDNGVGTIGRAGSVTAIINETTTFTITATNASGSVTQSVTVEVLSGPIIHSFTVMPDTVVSGGTATLAWDCDAESVTINQGVQATGITGNATVTASEPVTYTLTATKNEMSATAQVTLSVVSGPKINSFTATPDHTVADQPVTLAWDCDADTVSIDQGVTIAPDQTAGSTPVTLTGVTTYTLTAQKNGYYATRQVTVSWVAGPAILSFYATPQLVVGSHPVTLSWACDADTVSIDNGVGEVDQAGETVVILPATTTFTLTALKDGVPTTAQVTVIWVRDSIVVDYFTASPASLSAPGAALLQWSVEHADTVNIDGVEVVAVSSMSPYFGAQEGKTTFTLTAHQNDTGDTVVRTVEVLVDAPQVTIQTARTLPSASTLARDYAVILQALGGFGEYQWSAGNLPHGLSLDPETGLLSGQLDETATTTYSFDITVSAVGTTDPPATKTFDLLYERSPLTITTGDIGSAREKVPYSKQFTSVLGMGEKHWRISSSDKPGNFNLSMSDDGVLSGTPNMYGYWNFTVQVYTLNQDGSVDEHDEQSWELMIRLGWDRLDPFHDIFYRVLNTNGTEVIGPDGRPMCNDPYPDRGGKEVFGRMVVAFAVGTGDFTVQDARVPGGGLAPEFQAIEEARNFWDLGYWDGKPYPVGGAMAMYLPSSILDRFSRDQVNAKLAAILPLGALPVVRYYTPDGEEMV